MKGDRKGKWKTADKSIFKPDKEWKKDESRARRAKNKASLKKGDEHDIYKSDKRDWI